MLMELRDMYAAQAAPVPLPHPKSATVSPTSENKSLRKERIW